MLSKPFNVSSGSLSLSHTLPTFERSGDPSRSGGGETSYFPRRLFCTRKSGQSAWPCEPARVSTAAAADPSRFPSPSFCEARQARGGRERQGWGEKGGELPACTLSSRPGPKSRLRVLLLPACERAEEVERRSLAGGRGLGGGGLSVRAAEAPAIGRPRSHGVGAGAEAGAGPASARSLARARGPPRLHRHDTDTLSLQLLSEPGALGTRRRGQPEPRTPELARPPAPPPRRPPRGGPRLPGRGRRGSLAGSGQWRPAAGGGCSSRPAPSAGRSGKPARFGGGGGRGRRALPAAPGPPSSVPCTHRAVLRLRSGDLPGAPSPAPRPRPRAPGRGEALSSASLPRSRGRAAQARGEGSPRPAAAPPRLRALCSAGPDRRSSAAAREPGRPKLGARPRSPRRAGSGQALP